MQAKYSYPLTESINFSVYSQRPQYELIEVVQVHGTDIVPLCKANAQMKADGIYFYHSELAKNDFHIAIKTADCLPLAIYGKLGCALIHAGWRGLSKGILLHKILEGIEPQVLIIGPSIRVDSYEVGEDFKKNFSTEASFEVKEGKTHFNLQAEAMTQLKTKFPKLKVVDSELDTYKDDCFNSYRRNKTSQRNWNMLEIKV